MLKTFVMVLLMALPLAAEQSSDRRVRTDEPQIRALIEKGVARSATFASLVAALNDTDVIVYVESKVIRQGLAGYVLHKVVIGGPYRYVRLVVSPEGGDAHRIGVLAHELQHALEIARAPQVGRSETVEHLFARIGFRRWGCPRSCYETFEAVNVERRVRDELNVN